MRKGCQYSPVTRVLIACNDRLGTSMAGPAIRCWEMARALAGAGHEVHLAAPFPSDLSPAEFSVVLADSASLAREEAWADVLVVQGFVMSNHPLLARTQKHLVVDLYDPFVLENLEMYSDRPLEARRREHWPALATTTVQLRLGDFFLCANERQRDFWMGSLVALDRVNPLTHSQDGLLRKLIDTVPFGTPESPPVHSGVPAARGVLPGIEETARIAIWAGGIYNWFDPLSLIRAWPAVMAAVPSARLLFMGLKHPNPDVPEMAMAASAVALAESLGLRDKGVTFNLGWVPYERRADFLLEADIGVSTHYNHLETRLSFRTRFLDYIWAGLPVLATEGDSFAEWAAFTGAGRVVPFEDVGAIESALITLLGDEAARAECRAAVVAAAPDFTWARALEPLVSYCAAPWRAADLASGKPDLAGGESPPPGVARRAWWFLRREGVGSFARRAVGKARKVARARGR